MLTLNCTLIQQTAKEHVENRRVRPVRTPISSLGNSPIHTTYRVDNADLALFPGKIHTVDHPLIKSGDEITVTRRMSHGYGFIFFFYTEDNLEGFIRSDAVSEVR